VPNADRTPFFGSPTKLFEYMAAGKAIVASRLDQIGQVLDPSLDARQLPDQGPRGDELVRAVLAEPGNVAELVQALRFAIDHPDWREILGSNAREAVIDSFTWRHHVQAFLAALEGLETRS